ncbi:peptidoglycan hydrolase PcsB [Streptococcus cameli]
MKKKVLAALLVSTITLTNFGTVALVQADDTDAQIAAQENKINSISAQQAAAQAEVDAIQGRVDAIRAEQEKLNAENERLEAESRKLAEEIQQLSADIVSRDAALKEQARSAQTDASASSYINTILDSKSVVDAVSRVSAMREIVSANNRMLEQQKADKEAIAEKQKANQEAINIVEANWKTLADDAEELKAQEAALKVAQLNLAAEKATAEDQKAALLEQKAAAQAAAQAAAAQQAAYQAQQAALRQQQQQSVTPVQASTAGASTSTSTPAVTPTQTTPVQSAPVTQVSTNTPTPTPRYSSGSNTYPVGQCTWGVKEAAPWVHNYWGNANQWLYSARAAGYRTGSTPQVGAVAVWTSGYYGHVAVVTAVNGSQIKVVESNYAGNQYLGDFRGWFNPAADGVSGYIYPN